MEVRFKDGERLVALANRYPPLGKLFFLVPVDPASNNIRILVNRDAARLARESVVRSLTAHTKRGVDRRD